MNAATAHILLVGCGKMGTALLERWREQVQHGWHFSVIEPHGNQPRHTSAHNNTSYYSSLDDLPSSYVPYTIIFAVKPQSLAHLLPLYAARFGIAPLYVTIAAGKTLSFYLNIFGDDARVIRAMPNTPALVGLGMSALFASAACTTKDTQLANTLLASVGETVWLPKESLMDAATAISGSGPAYIFYFMECLIRAGLDAGLDEETTRKLVLHTVHGSSELAFMSSDSLEVLRKNVTSPGGTTEAALERLMSTNGMLKIVQEAIQNAIARARQLAS
jgi:pyrroline-5-carboxylate reductase